MALLYGLGLVLAVEGLLYAAFPGFMQRVMRAAIASPAGDLRVVGLAAAMIGLLIIWFTRA